MSKITTAEELDALPIREQDAWVAAVLRFMRERGYTVTAPGQELAAAGLLVDLLATVKAEAWDEGVEAAFQGMIIRQGRSDVLRLNPYREETRYALATNPSMGVAMTPERLASLVEAEPCPTCSGPVRRTVSMVCQTCGKDYAPREGDADDLPGMWERADIEGGKP